VTQATSRHSAAAMETVRMEDGWVMLVLPKPGRRRPVVGAAPGGRSAMMPDSRIVQKMGPDFQAQGGWSS